jgi:GNAT superfamily N-acetyltransferase
MPLRFREYTNADKEACTAIFTTNTPDFFREHELDDFVSFLDRLPCPYFVVENENGEMTACGGYAPQRGRLCYGMVARAYHRQGIGRFLLMERLKHWFQHHGPAHVSLKTSQHSAGFFAKAGFITRNITKDGLAPALDAHEMALELNGEIFE